MRYVETILPPSYLKELGVYVQTCAQIEYYACSAICKMEGLSESNVHWLARHDQLRNLGIDQLISALSSAAKSQKIVDPWNAYFIKLAGWLHQYSENRHRAVHGRHFVAEGTMTVSIDVAARGRRTERLVTVSPEQASEAVRDADNILRSLVRYCKLEQE